MTSNTISSNIRGRGRYADDLIKIYRKFGSGTFTYTDIVGIIPTFKKGSLGSLHRNKILLLENGNKRAHHNMVNMWKFSSMAVENIRKTDRKEITNGK